MREESYEFLVAQFLRVLDENKKLPEVLFGNTYSVTDVSVSCFHLLHFLK